MTYEDYVSDNKGRGIYLLTREAYNRKYYGRRYPKKMGSLKRKRSTAFTSNGGTRKRRRTFRVGRDRTSGYYGRYSGSNAELKFFDVTLDDAVIATGGVIVDTVNDIAQGVTENTRIGRKCVLRKIGWKYILDMAVSTVAGRQDTVRLILYKDKQCNGAAATSALIMETTNVRSFRNLSTSGRFTILMDRTYDMNMLAMAGDGTTQDTQPMKISGQFYKDCNIPLEFDATSGALGTIRSNNLGVLLISETGQAGITSQLRMRFSDGS